jgi:hypothetical protein
MNVHSSTESAAVPATRTRHSLDTLAQLSPSDLEALYRAGRCPSDMRAADGALVGRMLAVRSVPRGLAPALRRWAAARSFIWEGKTFQARNESHGTGINRVALPGLLGRQNLFPFDTSFGPSSVDGKPTLILDYDLAANPPYIRRVHDEIRELSPGLFLGPAMWKRGPAKVLLLWFALDARLS